MIRAGQKSRCASSGCSIGRGSILMGVRWRPSWETTDKAKGRISIWSLLFMPAICTRHEMLSERYSTPWHPTRTYSGLVIAGLLCASTVPCRLERWAVMARFGIVLRNMNRGELFASALLAAVVFMGHMALRSKTALQEAYALSTAFACG